MTACACPSSSAQQCAWLRYRDDSAEPCYCPCHEQEDDETHQGDQPRSERGREGMKPAVCESAAGRGNGASALATLPQYASPVGGPMGAGQAAAAAPSDDKRFATLKAEAAHASYELRTDPLGGFYATRWGYMTMFETLDEFERWLELVTGKKAA